MNRGAVVVAQHRALAAQRLGDQRELADVSPVASAVGWNCTNSRSVTARAGEQSQRDAVSAYGGGLVVAA